eukprot:m.21845 g.21845  ORF g.21845 m.21845 type:complete len:896 (-) comp13567_c0_seq1:184-2871(-)
MATTQVGGDALTQPEMDEVLDSLKAVEPESVIASFAEDDDPMAGVTIDDDVKDADVLELQEFELKLLDRRATTTTTTHVTDDCDAIVTAALERDSLKVLNTAFAQELIESTKAAVWETATAIAEGSKDATTNTQTIESVIAEKVASVLAAASPSEISLKRQHTMLVGVAALELFIQMNWTGPPVDPLDIEMILPCSTNKVLTDVRVRDQFTIDGEVVEQTISTPLLLSVARGLLCTDFPGSEPTTLAIWSTRCAFIHQHLLDSPVAPLKSIIYTKFPKAMKRLSTLCNTVEVSARLLLERGMHHSFYNDAAEAQDCWMCARDSLGLVSELSGTMGVRTKFQTKKTAQLILDIKHGHTQLDGILEVAPQIVDMNDEVRLEKMKLDDDSAAQEKLSIIEQATILALCINVKNNNAKQGITVEEMLPFVNCVANAPQNWTVQSLALWTKSTLETDSARAVHRSVDQMQSISSEVDSSTGATAKDRLDYFFTLNLPSHLQLDCELAKLNEKNGLVRDALRLYERWNQWEKMIDCYQHLEMDGKAESLVREQMKIEETPALWCVLGDLKRKPEFYEKAWEISNQRSARAMRSLGLLYLRAAEKEYNLKQPCKEIYMQAIDAYQKAVKLNGMHASAWFSLGCAAMRAEEWKVSCLAFRSRLTLDSDDFESWNNLARGYIKLKMKRRAFYALREAVKFEYNNWKVWDNYVATAVDVGAFVEVILAIGRLIDIKKGFDDHEILHILCLAVTDSSILNIDKRPVLRLMPKVGQLLLRIKSTSTTLSHETWEVMARFYTAIKEPELAHEAFRSGFQAAKAVESWQQNDNDVIDVCNSLNMLVDDCLELGTTKEMSMGKMLAIGTRSMLTKAIEQGYDSEIKTTQLARIETLISTLTDAVAASKPQ